MAFDINEPKVVCIVPCKAMGETVIALGEYVEIVSVDERDKTVMVRSKNNSDVFYGFTESWRFLLVDHPMYDVMLLFCVGHA
jgi:hypothetical protein